MEENIYDGIKISVDSEELRNLIRTQIDDALATYLYKFALWNECYLEFHGVTLKQYLSGDESYTIQQVEQNGQMSQKIIYDRALKLKVPYTAIRASLSQISRTVPDFIGETDNFSLQGVVDTFAKLIKREWKRSKTPLEIDAAFWSFILFDEMIFRTFYSEEKRDRHEKIYSMDDKEEKVELIKDKLIYRGVKTKAINPFEFIPSPDWRTDIQDCSWVGIRKFRTPEEAMSLYPDILKEDKYKTITGYYSSSSEKKILDPYANIREVYKAKIDPETQDVIGTMLQDMNTSTSWTTRELVEQIEYFNKALDCRVVMMGDIIVEAEYMEDDFYPIVAHKGTRDNFTARGISAVEQILPLAQAADGIFDMKVKNLVLQLSSTIIYNTKYFPETPSFQPGTALGVELAPGEHLDGDVMNQMSKYSQNFEISREQKDLEQKIYGGMGINEMMAGMPATGSDNTAKESMIRQSASTANLDYEIRTIENEVFTEIANQWGKYIIKSYENDFVFSLISDSETKYFMYLGDVTVEEKEDYSVYRYKNFKFWQPKRDTDHMIQKIIEDMINDRSEGESIEGESPEFLGTEMKTDMQTAEEVAVDQEEVPEGDYVGTWEDFVQRIIDESGGKIQAVLTRGELQALSIKFSIVATQGVLMNKEIRRTQLGQIAPYIAQLGPAGVAPLIRALVKAFDYSLQEIAPELVTKQDQPQATLMDPSGKVVAEGNPQDIQAQMQGQVAGTQPNPMNEALRPENLARQVGPMNAQNLPGNPEQTQNPQGINF